MSSGISPNSLNSIINRSFGAAPPGSGGQVGTRDRERAALSYSLFLKSSKGPLADTRRGMLDVAPSTGARFEPLCHRSGLTTEFDHRQTELPNGWPAPTPAQR